MKKTALIKIVLVFCFIMLMMLPASASENNIVVSVINDKFSVTGKADPAVEGVSVSIQCFAPGKTAEDLKEADVSEYTDILACHSETETDENGEFCFSFYVNQGYGVYTIKLYIENTDEVYTVYANYAKSIKPVLECDFESYTSGLPKGFSNITNSVNTSYVESEEKGRSFKTTGSNLTKYLSNGISSGKYLLTYSFMKPDEEYENNDLNYLLFFDEGYTGLNNTSQLFEIFSVNADVKMGFYYRTDGWAMNSNTVQGEKDKWYRVDVWIDMDKRTAAYSVNNKYLGSTCVNDRLESIEGFAFICPSTMCLDDVALYKVDYEFAKIQNDMGRYVPFDYADYVKISLDTKIAGNIFSDEEKLLLPLSLTNVSDNNAQINLSYTVTDMNDKIVFSGNEDAEIVSEYSKVISPEELGYGTYKLNIKVKNADTGEIFEKSFDFSIIKASDNVNEKLGVNVHFDKFINVWKNETGILDKAGFGSLRTSASFANIDGDLKNYFAFSKENNMPTTAVLPISVNGAVPTTEAQLLDLQNAYAEAAKKLGDNIVYYEIGNETNLNSTVTAAQYAKVLEYAYKGIKSVNTDAKVVAMSTSLVRCDWIKEVLDASDGIYFDCISIHPYIDVAPEKPGWTNYGRKTWVNQIKELKSLMEEYGISDKEIWITEAGYYTTTNEFSLEEQASYTMRQLLLNDAWDLADKYYVYTLTNPEVDPPDKEANYGIINCYTNNLTVPYSAKPIYVAFANYNYLMQNFAFEKQQNISDEDFVNVYTDGNRKMYALWTSGEEKNIYLNVDFNEANLYDMYGNLINLEKTAGGYNIKITGQPVYLLEVKQELTVTSGGKAISSTDEICDNKINVKFSDNTEVVIVAAEYKDNRIKKVSYYENNPFENNEEYVNFDVDLTGEYDEIKVFAVDSLDKLKPLIEETTLRRRENNDK